MMNVTNNEGFFEDVRNTACPKKCATIVVWAGHGIFLWLEKAVVTVLTVKILKDYYRLRFTVNLSYFRINKANHMLSFFCHYYNSII